MELDVSRETASLVDTCQPSESGGCCTSRGRAQCCSWNKGIGLSFPRTSGTQAKSSRLRLPASVTPMAFEHEALTQSSGSPQRPHPVSWGTSHPRTNGRMGRRPLSCGLLCPVSVAQSVTDVPSGGGDTVQTDSAALETRPPNLVSKSFALRGDAEQNAVGFP